MKKLLFLMIFFNVLLFSQYLFPMETVAHKLILGGKIPSHISVRKNSPYIPMEDYGFKGFGMGIGLYTEFIPFSYFAFESGLYFRAFNLGEVYYNELQFPGIVKFRFPVSDILALSIGGGITYCIPISGDIWITTAGQDEVDIPRDDLTRDLGFVVKMGFHIRPSLKRNIYLNIDIGVEHVGKVIKIKQTDLFSLLGLGFGLY